MGTDVGRGWVDRQHQEQHEKHEDTHKQEAFPSDMTSLLEDTEQAKGGTFSSLVDILHTP